MSDKLPEKEGFYWAKWKICDEGTADEHCFKPHDDWEVVQVFINGGCDDEDPDYFRVFVGGVEKTQSLENFFWGKEVVRDVA